MGDLVDADCPNCDDGGDLIRSGPFVGCESCSGMWAPADIVDDADAADEVPGPSLDLGDN